MDKKNPNKEKQKENKPKKKLDFYQIYDKSTPYYKPYMGPDGYLHCPGCKRRYEPPHLCERPGL